MKQEYLITAIKVNISSDEAKMIGKLTQPHNEEPDMTESFYPYLHFKAKYETPFLLGHKKLLIDCLVDGCNGNAATSDSFESEHLKIQSRSLMITKTEYDDAQYAAKRYVINHLSRKFKAISNYKVSMKAEGLIYKLFWVFKYNNHSVLVDSVNGSSQKIDIKQSA